MFQKHAGCDRKDVYKIYCNLLTRSTLQIQISKVLICKQLKSTAVADFPNVGSTISRKLLKCDITGTR
jgi:hypothetical protein